MAKSLVVGVAEVDPFFEDGNFNVGLQPPSRAHIRVVDHRQDNPAQASLGVRLV